MKNNNLSRNCPRCHKEILYGEVWYRNKQERLGTICKSCSNHNKGKSLPLSVKQKIGNAKKGKIASIETRQKMSISQTGRKHPENVKQKMKGCGNGMYGVHRYNNKNPFHGKRHTDESKRKMRVAACEKVLKLLRSKNGRFANSNPKESGFFNNLEKERNWNGIYCNKYQIQHFIKNLGYFVDYYEPTLNIVVEYDEPRHYVYGNLKEKDIKRMNNIKNYLGCRFLRFNEYTKEIKEY